jgi:hypothetical protein
MDDKTALVVIDTQVGMFETFGVPPVLGEPVGR